MLRFQISLLLFRSIALSHNLYTCRRVAESHAWQLVSAGRLCACPRGNHPLISQQYRHSEMLHLGAPLSFHTPPATLFLQRKKPQALSQASVCQGFHPFQFLAGTVCFEEHSCGCCQAAFQRKGFRWLRSLCLCQTFTFLLTPHDGSVTHGSAGRRAWPLVPGLSYMARGMEQLRNE